MPCLPEEILHELSLRTHAISPNEPHLPILTHVTQIILDQLQRAPFATSYPHISPKEPHLPHQTSKSDQKSPICHTLPTYQIKRAPFAIPDSHIRSKEPNLPHLTHISTQKRPICRTRPTYQPQRVPSATPYPHIPKEPHLPHLTHISVQRAPSARPNSHELRIYSSSPFNTICNDMANRNPTHVNSEYTQSAPSVRSVTMWQTAFWTMRLDSRARAGRRGHSASRCGPGG